MQRIIPVTLLLFATTAVAHAQNTLNLPIAKGPFQPSMESLQQYQTPDWFRDAKFGIWAHWGPQAVPMDGDWYARGMYEPGNKHYKYHLANYGHPSVFGYKDIIPLWKAEKWDPDRLMKLYKDAGAKYFVSMGTHHDNFFLWNSKLHRWNAANMGPKRDIVGDWQKAAKKQGLRFGVSEHLGASFTWFQSSHRSDKTGPMAGVPYDGADPKYQDLYHFPAEPGDTGWYSNNPRWQQQWYTEIKELVDNYKPDMLYTDGGVPFGNEVGRSMIAHLYNSDAARHGGKIEAVYNCKQKSDGRWVEDVERGIMPRIDPYPWQTDTSIGDWYYNRDWKFRPIKWVVHTLVDNVSKNGNLLLNVVQRPDGSLDPEVEQLLTEMAAWTKVHGEAIYGSRPWLVYGEGVVTAKGGSFKEDYQYSARDIRFTTKGDALYAIALGQPDDGQLLIRSLGKPAGETINQIRDLRLLGYNGKLEWSQTPEGLTVRLPATKVSDVTVALKISGTNLKPVPIPVVIQIVRPDSQGNLMLSADTAELNGPGVQVEEKGGKPNVGFWDSADASVSWNAAFSTSGTYNVSATVATTNGDVPFVVEIGDQTVSGKSPNTGAWEKFETVRIGQIEVKRSCSQVIKVRPESAASWKAINLQSISLKPVK